MAWAAFPKTCSDTAFNPATSTTEYIIVMSLQSTYGAVLPLATVDTINLGKPIGKDRIAAVINAVPPLPPMPITPATCPEWHFEIK